MPMEFKFRIDGLEATMEALQELPTIAMQKGAVRNAWRKAAKPVRDAAEAICPDSGFDHKNKLRDSIVIGPTLKASQKERTGYKVDRTMVTMFVGSTAPHAHLVEFGTGPRYKQSGVFTGQMAPQPFMRMAWDQTKDMVLRIFTGELRTAIYKAARRLARRAEKGTLTKSQIKGLNK